MLNSIILGDCLDIMKNIPDKSIDSIIADPPFQITQNFWDSIIPLDKMWIHLNRIIKDNGSIVLFCGQPFTSKLICSNLENFKYVWIWEKNFKTGHLNAHHMPMRKHEDIAVFYKNKCTYNPQELKPYNKIKKRGSNGENYNVSGTENFQEFTNYPSDILQFDRDLPSIHPTQKSLALCEYLVKTYTNEGDSILDFCAGSGTTLLAAKNNKRNYIGIEKEEKYYNLITTRLV